MWRKIAWNRVLIALSWLVSITGLVVLMSFIEGKKAGVICRKVDVYIPGTQSFIDRHEVDRILQVSSHNLIGRKMEDINIHDLENKLKANPFIEFAKMYADMDGVIHAEITQRQPAVRILNRFDQDFYVDQHGLKIPLSDNFTAPVLVANGNIDEIFSGRIDTLHTKLAKDLFKTAEFIRKDTLWNAQIAQIYVDQNREIELIPRIGDQKILVGNADSLESKFHNLKIFYKQALPQIGWDKYKIINIKYANQVVGVKTENLKTDTAKHIAAVKKDTLQSVKDSSPTN
ncbi:cell division protein FtsQ [Mucilaginibacter robiniae]|uniref:Cell division protein FtsQ n=1 Tax=Mucilaginibacter robiniae TaxID=2728022 RepID=A0A7L5E932_9SPHI|nr:cell division protein FtsQ [Mucilaginibacter robiniae]QJD97383.1 cell division protein FtsQ [Mucilaginibacter robiniae]